MARKASAPSTESHAPNDATDDAVTAYGARQPISRRAAPPTLAPKAGAERVRVTVLQTGFYDNRLREPGHTFDFALAAGETLPEWVERVGQKTAPSEVEADADDALPDDAETDDVI